MKRRDFIKYSTLGATIPFWLQSCFKDDPSFPVHVHSDHQTGHLIMEAMKWKKVKKDRIDLAIVGGGLSGLAAAYQSKKLNYRLFELSSTIGGSSAAAEHNGIKIAQGAHYELAYPDNYGNDVLRMLEELKIIRYEPWKKMWGFIDQQHIIPYSRRQQCYDNGQIRSDVIPPGLLKSQFEELILSYSGKLNLPSRLIQQPYRELNDITFQDFLSSRLNVTSAFLKQMDYHMADDYGGDTNQVSALAGLLYFACRPYYTQAVDLFSPPNGNDYFAQRIIQKLDSNRIHCHHLVSKIEKTSSGYMVQVLDVQKKEIHQYESAEVIYAGQKHALKYIFPGQETLFKNTYAPWMVVNFVTGQEKNEYGFWQNEYLGENPKFLGFIDSSVQAQQSLKGYRVYTGYYCLDEKDRDYLTTIPESGNQIANETKGYLEKMLRTKLKVDACFIKVMGHAMPIPVKGYLFQDANQLSNAEMIYAGVDNYRLPLLYEALDSGIQAAELI